MNDTGFWWILLATAVYGVLHSLLASKRAKAFAARIFGEAAYRRFYRLFFVIAGGITFVPILALLAALPDRVIYTIPAPWRWLTLALQGAALAAMAIAVAQTGMLEFVGLRQAAGARYEGDPKLATGGLYAWARHPIYTASLVLLWLAPTLTWNLLALIIALSTYMLVGAYFFEEPKLLDEFGQAYRDYRAHTPMIVPGLRLRRQGSAGQAERR